MSNFFIKTFFLKNSFLFSSLEFGFIVLSRGEKKVKVVNCKRDREELQLKFHGIIMAGPNTGGASE